jgi:hypothetical protein
MDYRKELLDILAKEKLSIDDLKIVIKERTQLSKKIKMIKKQLDELNDCLITLEKNFDSRIDEISGRSLEVNNLYVEVFKDDLMKTVEIIQDNLPNYIEGILEKTEEHPVVKLREKTSGILVGEVFIYLNENQVYIANVKIIDKRTNFQCEEEFTLKKPNRVYKVISYINTNLNYDE